MIASVNELLLADWSAVGRKCAHDTCQIRAAVETDGHHASLKQRRDHAADRRLAVGPGHVHGPIFPVRSAEIVKASRYRTETHRAIRRPAVQKAGGFDHTEEICDLLIG